HNIMGDISEFKRGQIVGACLAGASVTETASLCDVSKATVSRVMSAYHQEGRITSNRSNCGRKRKLSERDVRVLTRISVSKNSARVAHWSTEMWKNVIWSDESSFTIFSTRGRVGWRSTGSDSMLWGGFLVSCVKGVGEMTFKAGTMDATVCTRILNEKTTHSLKKLGRKGISQCDNDSKHTEKNHFMSPDLKPIQDLRIILKWSQLKRIICEEWHLANVKNDISPQICARLVSSMPRRIKSAIKKKGGHTNY
uniref:Transposase Tc1-like domain-containing protein n=1 Tax=Seriola dumerili TaxID=41447 RepID=A0A3B4TWU5_SERDU